VADDHPYITRSVRSPSRTLIAQRDDRWSRLSREIRLSGNLVVSEALFAATEQDVLRVQAGWGDGQWPEQRLLSPADGERKREDGLAVS
jgi:hypothetical protein